MKNNRISAAIEKFFGKHTLFAVSLALLICVTSGVTLGYIVTKTPSVINIFKPVLYEDLVIQKVVEHPFGNSYKIPEYLEFDFKINLGSSYAENTVVKTTQGEKTVNSEHCITLKVKPGKSEKVENLLIGTLVTVEEISDRAGFTVQGGAIKIHTIERGENIVTYINEYKPSPVAPVNLTVSGTKKLKNREWKEGDSFTFDLEYQVANGEWENIDETTVTYELIASGDSENPEYIVKPDFEKFDFNEAIQNFAFEKAGTYAFRVSEKKESIGGVIYDDGITYFDVLVGDADMDGALEIQSVTVDGNPAVQDEHGIFNVDASFVNEYAPEGSAEVLIQITKQVDDKSGQNKTPTGFEFELYDDENKLIETSDVTSTAGEASIKLVYDASDAGKTFVYTLKEKNAGQTIQGMAYSDAVYRLMVLVKDNGDGTISAVVDDYDAETLELFEQEPQGEVPKTEEIPETESQVPELEDTLQEDEKLQLVEDTEKEPDDEKPVQEFETVEEDLTENQTVEENQTEEPEIVEEELPVTLVGTSADVKGSNVYKASFTNIYDPQDAGVLISGDKDLNGREMKAGEFSFHLYETEADFVIADDAEPKDIKANADAEGNFVFDELVFGQTGTYYYVVKENASEPLGGVSYDDTRYQITVNVQDQAGELSADVTINSTKTNEEVTEIKFINSYRAKAVELLFTGKKVLKGGLLKDDMFKFALYSADSEFNITGDAIQTVTNKADGGIAFEALTFDTEGTYYYLIEEDDSDPIDDTEYDDTRYGLTVMVEDPGDGQLTADLAIEEIGVGKTETILFENTYTYVEPEVPDKPEEEPDKPEDTEEPEVSGETDNVQSGGTETGDVHQVECMVVLLVVSGAVAVIVWKKRFRI